MRFVVWSQSAAILAGSLVALVCPGLAQSAAETVVTRVFVPSATQRVGEVRLLWRDDVPVVQTLLYTKLLERVVREITAKEEANWPGSLAGRADAERYLEALRAAEEAIPRVRAGGPKVDRQRRMLIEFYVDGSKGVVTFATFQAEGERDDIRVGACQRLAQIEVSKAYAERNMKLIAADAFGVPAADVEGLWRRTPHSQRTDRVDCSPG